MILLAFAIFGLVLAVVPAGLFARNWSLYRKPSPGTASQCTRVSVLIPARNEEAGIGQAVGAALASRNVELEVVVLDDHSTDRTAGIVREIAAVDSRVRVASAPPLPAGWCGKQHACHVLSTLARYDVFAFMDADVRLTPGGLAQAVSFLRIESPAPLDLASGIPGQDTGTLLERLLIPLIHFVLLGFLPIERMRRSTAPAYGAGCGQFFVTRRAAYEQAGGHAAIRASLHDGITLPRAFRRAGLRTDLFDATDAATCRMYRSARQVWRGLEKNATEGMAAPGAILPWTLVLLGGQVMPLAVLWISLTHSPLPIVVTTLSVTALLLSLAVRCAAATRFRQPWISVVLHPVGVTLLLLIQWSALLRKLTGRPSNWRGRSYGEHQINLHRPEPMAATR